MLTIVVSVQNHIEAVEDSVWKPRGVCVIIFVSLYINYIFEYFYFTTVEQTTVCRKTPLSCITDTYRVSVFRYYEVKATLHSRQQVIVPNVNRGSARDRDATQYLHFKIFSTHLGTARS